VCAFIDLEFPYAQFPCKNLTGDELYPIVWEAIQWLELCGFKVLATICDGVANNHQFIHMHGTPKSPLVYKYTPKSPLVYNHLHLYYINHDIQHKNTSCGLQLLPKLK